MQQQQLNLRTLMLSEKVISKGTYSMQHSILFGDTNICTKSKERQGNNKSQDQELSYSERGEGGK